MVFLMRDWKKPQHKESRKNISIYTFNIYLTLPMEKACAI